MKIEVIREKMLEAVTYTEKMSGKHVSLPVLSLILIEADVDIKIKATNLDMGIEYDVSGKVFNKGKIALSGQILRSFLSGVKDKNITLETEDGFIKAISSSGEVKIKTEPCDDFPEIPKVTDGDEITFSSQDLVSIEKSVGFSASLSSIKPELQSVYLYVDENNSVVAVSTDSFRLSEKKINIKKKGTLKEVLIPEKNFSEIVRVVSTQKEDVLIKSNKNQASFFVPGIHITTRVVDATFPDYKQIIPKEFVATATVFKDELLESLKLTSVFSDNFNQVSVSILPSKNKLTLQTKNSNVGEGEFSLKGSFSGDDISVNFNHRYILDCLSAIDSESVNISFSGTNKPAIIKASENANYKYLVMPMNR